LLDSPVAGGVRGDAALVYPPGAMLDEHHDIQPVEQHGVHVQEIDCEDPGGLGMEELPPGRACPAGRRIDARGVQDLPHRGRRDCHAELGQLAVDPAVSPQRILCGQANGEACDAGAVGGRRGLRTLFNTAAQNLLAAVNTRCPSASPSSST
jgi:hypothetical protein